MKVVTLSELLAMPQGTLFHDWVPCMVNSGLNVFVKQVQYDDELPFNDFYYIDLQPGEDDLMGGPAFEPALKRWGLYDESAQFIVYEPHEVGHLRKCLEDLEQTAGVIK